MISKGCQIPMKALNYCILLFHATQWWERSGVFCCKSSFSLWMPWNTLMAESQAPGGSSGMQFSRVPESLAWTSVLLSVPERKGTLVQMPRVWYPCCHHCYQVCLENKDEAKLGSLMWGESICGVDWAFRSCCSQDSPKWDKVWIFELASEISGLFCDFLPPPPPAKYFAFVMPSSESRPKELTHYYRKVHVKCGNHIGYFKIWTFTMHIFKCQFQIWKKKGKKASLKYLLQLLYV